MESGGLGKTVHTTHKANAQAEHLKTEYCVEELVFG